MFEENPQTPMVTFELLNGGGKIKGGELAVSTNCRACNFVLYIAAGNLVLPLLALVFWDAYF